jgi:hypothetical protein
VRKISRFANYFFKNVPYGLTFDNRIMHAITKIVYQDSGQLALKVATVVLQLQSQGVNFTIIRQLLGSIWNLFSHLLDVLKIRPSVVSQAQFDELSEMKRAWDEKKRELEEDKLIKLLQKEGKVSRLL